MRKNLIVILIIIPTILYSGNISEIDKAIKFKDVILGTPASKYKFMKIESRWDEVSEIDYVRKGDTVRYGSLSSNQIYYRSFKGIIYEIGVVFKDTYDNGYNKADHFVAGKGTQLVELLKKKYGEYEIGERNGDADTESYFWRGKKVEIEFFTSFAGEEEILIYVKYRYMPIYTSQEYKELHSQN